MKCNYNKIKMDFWKWWENEVEYMQGDAVDIAFVWDTPIPLITESAFY